jgi:hypothetical protein
MAKRQTCYMCERVATSKEHVPPKCIFPELKDLPVGFDFRKNLISVPSCDLHNSAKSSDDEFFLFIVSMQYYGNFYKNVHFESKVMRAFNRSPDRFISMMEDLTPVECTGLDGEKFESAMFKVDLERFDKVAHHLACGIYHHHFGKKWLGKSNTLTNIFGTNGNISSPENRFIASQTTKVSTSFVGLPSHGENQEIFQYQIYSRNEDAHALRFEFFEGAEIFVVLGQDV